MLESRCTRSERECANVSLWKSAVIRANRGMQGNVGQWVVEHVNTLCSHGRYTQCRLLKLQTWTDTEKERENPFSI